MEDAGSVKADVDELAMELGGACVGQVAGGLGTVVALWLCAGGAVSTGRGKTLWTIGKSREAYN